MALQDRSGLGPRPTDAPSLPERELGDDALIAAVRSGGCPLCVVIERSGRRYLEALLWENVNDGPFRERLLAGGGFCAPHERALVRVERDQAGGSLGVAILGRSVLAARVAGLRGALRQRRGRPSALRHAMEAAVDCPICALEAGACDRAAVRFVALAEPAGPWREALAAAPFCLAHLGTLLATAATERTGEAAQALTAGQLARLDELVERLDGFVLHSSFDRRHELAEDERRAVAEVVAVLAGTAPRP